MNLKVNKKLLFFILALIFLLLAIITIRSTYARYVTALTAKSTVELGSWLISVNNQNIIDNSNVSDKIIPVFNQNLDYIAEGVIAPTSSGYVEITLDYSKVTVPFRYDISFDSEATIDLEDFILTSYSIDGGETIDVDDPNALISDTISPDAVTRTRTLKLNFQWIDGTVEIFDDIDDTTFSLANDELGLRFNMLFTQLQPTT